MNEPMTLIERLENPQRRQAKDTDLLILDTERSEADMREAARSMRGEEACRKALVNEVKRLSGALVSASEVCRSAYQIADRSGVETNWPTFKQALKRALDEQHSIMNPKTQDAGLCV